MTALEVPFVFWWFPAGLALILYTFARYVSYDLSLKSPRRVLPEHYQKRDPTDVEQPISAINVADEHARKICRDLDVNIKRQQPSTQVAAAGNPSLDTRNSSAITSSSGGSSTTTSSIG